MLAVISVGNTRIRLSGSGRLVLGGPANIFTGYVDEEFPGTMNCGDVRFCFLMTLEIGSEPEAGNEISGFTANHLFSVLVIHEFEVLHQEAPWRC